MSGFVPTEPGTVIARVHGCTCPVQRPVPIAGGGFAYERADDCPLHAPVRRFMRAPFPQRQRQAR